MNRSPVTEPAVSTLSPDVAARQPIVALSTLGHGSHEEARLLTLLSAFDVEVFPFDRKQKWHSFRQLLARLKTLRPALVALEGTGLAGGVALLLARWLYGVRFVLSSGDAVGPWVSMQVPLAGPLFGWYERMLYRWCSGFIGWTPYLAGRALTSGAPRVMTAAGWADAQPSPAEIAAARQRVRAKLGISESALVVGLAGSLVWSKPRQYCYGWELVQAATRIQRDDLVILLVGDGSGMPVLQKLAGERLGKTILLPGRVPRAEVLDYLAAMDVASLPQSVDGVGSFRYTTKLSEYLATGLPVVTGEIPLAYDLDDGWLWRLPGQAPWDERYLAALSELFESLTPAVVQARAQQVPRQLPLFDQARQVRQATGFIQDLLDAAPGNAVSRRP